MIVGCRRSLLLASAALSWTPAAHPQISVPRPKLVVVIAIDQFRSDYLQRFQRYFTKGGFNLLLRRGASYTQAYYQHAVTQTCPGHAVILTGSHANVNGIVANAWYNASLRRAEYCAADSLTQLIGAGTEGRSPRNLLDSTVGDELKRATAGRSRIITVAGKDRSAIMLGGHLADAAYWTEDTLFVTSTYYMKELPAWVKDFNASGAVTRYRGATWDRLLPPSAYRIVGADDVAAEENPAGMGRTFPHRLSAGRSSPENFISAFQTSPFENEVIVDFAMEAVARERLGQDEDPDLLAIGFSANDLIGHSYGPDSHEVMDVVLRTDRLLERFFDFLTRRVGLNNLVIVLTSDHGVSPLPELVRQRNPRAPAARIDPSIVAAAAEKALRARFGAPRRPSWLDRPNWIIYDRWPWLYLNLPGLEDKKISIDEAEQIAQEAVERVPGVEQAITAGRLMQQRKNVLHSRAELSFHPARSGSLYYVLAPYLLPGSKPEGTDHGSPWEYDTHVPLLWLGPSITPGAHEETVSVADIAPTLAALLGVEPPAGSQGRVLREMMNQPVDSTMTAMP
jgi:predicted AlkP superfamily pyrophosphatase or phosphodiesterase